ncbi:MAG: hypothetical protein IJ874_09915 [Ruminococcus sp.]|nr:hypothetical protein [Ruminococcus sp.]
MKKKKRFSLLKFLLIVLCIVLIIASAAINIGFSISSVPKISDRYIYVVGNDAPLGTDVTEGAALIARDAADITLAAGDIIICYPADSPSELKLRSINSIVDTESGERRYFTRDAYHEDTVDSIPKSSIAAVCTGYPESLELGKFITFTRSVRGIVIELIIPCLILVILLIAKIASASSREDEDDLAEDEELQDKPARTREPAVTPIPGGADEPARSQTAAAPLFDDTNNIQTTEEFEAKKRSITENFSQKKVDPDSPYQKEKERTQQFKALRAATGNTGKIASADQLTQESPFAPERRTSLPVSDPVREEALRKTAEAEKQGISTTGSAEKPAYPDIPTPDQKVLPVEPAQAEPAKKSSSPDISDILSKTETNRRKRDTASMSVDDLLKIIAEEKKKL